MNTTANALLESGIPTRYLDKTFENWIAETDYQKTVFGTIFDYATNFASVRQRGTSLIIAGLMGTGKTHLAIAIAGKVLSQGFSVKYAKTIGIAGGEDEEVLTEAVLNDLITPDLLILDDVGDYYTEEGSRAVCEVIYRRYDDQKPTILVTNEALPELTEYLSEKAIDRLREGGGKWIPFDWNSFRRISK